MDTFRNLFGRPNIKKLKAQNDIDTLIRLLNAPNSPSVRAQAATALGEMGAQKAVDALVLNLNDYTSEVQVSAIEALGRIGDKKAVDSLIPLLQYTDADVEHSVIRALGRLGDEKAIDPLLGLLESSGSRTLSIVREALKRWDSNQRVAEALSNPAMTTKQDQRSRAIDWWKGVDSSRKKCDVCSVTISASTGYLLQTSEILQSEAYIKYATRIMSATGVVGAAVPGLDSVAMGALMPLADFRSRPQVIENVKKVTTPWLVCNRCRDRYFAAV